MLEELGSRTSIQVSTSTTFGELSPLTDGMLGVMCDVPAHIYTLLDIPNPEWPNFYGEYSLL
jgi:hypothetical protein